MKDMKRQYKTDKNLNSQTFIFELRAMHHLMFETLPAF